MSATEAEADLSEDERRGLELVRQTNGIHQSDFWKELDVTSRTGSRIVESLVEEDLVEREETVYDGHNTYYITPMSRDLDFSLLMAGETLSPFVADEDADANDDAFSRWIMNLAYEE